MTEETVDHRRLIIAGTGIAGLTAAIYAGRANNEPLVLEGDEPGGQLTLTTDVANYPGFPDGIGGPELVQRMKDQATQFGADLEHGVVEDVTKRDDGTIRVELSNGGVYTADAFIAASGASARTLGIPGEEELMGYGLSTCATCDGAFFRGEDMLVVGGGDAAMEEATFLTKFADTVYLAHRREEFRAEALWVERVRKKAEQGYVRTAGGRGEGQTRTDVDGIFAAGDVVDHHYQQAITAGGLGCKAAIDADEYLEDVPERDAEAAEVEADD
ncbi:hypothetical protein BRC65_07880 [Halobacteriales archaeon QH_2_65_14]|nr:MAG: hypothetical protein BRC65_07880 [Halobacteriales archaeon QH_2_65_14]